MIYVRAGLVAIVLVLCFVVSLPVQACPFCSAEAGPTLVGEYAGAAMVVLGSFGKGELGSKGAFDEGVTEFVIEKVLKAHPYLDNKKNIKRMEDGKPVIMLPKYLQSKSDFLLFCDVYKGMIDPYRGVELQGDSEMVKYLEGAVKLKEAAQADRLRYCFDFLNNPEYEVSIDAYREYAKADYKDYKEMADTLPADALAGWLQDPKTPSYRYGLYASLLGHCGGEKHARLIHSMLEDLEKRKGSGIDGLFFAYTLLDTKNGWNYLTGVLGNPKEEFLMRYSALRTVRIIHKERPDLLPEKELVHGVALLLDHADMADFAVEDLRKWKRWEMTDQVLSLFKKKSHDISVVRRAILRFALQSPAASAANFVRAQRQRDKEWVKDTEELLKLEVSPN